MTDNDVPDSTDWLKTPLSALAAVEGALRCQVCKDFYKTPMITSCSHTFCSLCIRRALSNDGKCPLCRASEQELKLRSNWSLEETVEAFIKARPATLELARNGGALNVASKRKVEEEASTPESKRLRTSARLSKNRAAVAVESIPDSEEEVVEGADDDDGDYVSEPNDGLVPCPVCQSRMKEWQVFKHLETCPGPSPPRRRSGESSSSSTFGRQQNTKPLERLPAINYSMLKENALRKKLAELGISNQGPRHLLERRHKEWMTIWNANCDAARPKKRSELLQDLDVWERTQGGRVHTTFKSVQNTVMVKDKDFDGAAWASKHDSSFKDLIASARKSRMEAKKKMEEAKAEEEKKKAQEEAKSSSTTELAPAPVPQSSGPTQHPDPGQPESASMSSQPPPKPPHHTSDISLQPSGTYYLTEDQKPQTLGDWNPPPSLPNINP